MKNILWRCVQNLVTVSCRLDSYYVASANLAQLVGYMAINVYMYVSRILLVNRSNVDQSNPSCVIIHLILTKSSVYEPSLGEGAVWLQCSWPVHGPSKINFAVTERKKGSKMMGDLENL